MKAHDDETRAAILDKVSAAAAALKRETEAAAASALGASPSEVDLSYAHCVECSHRLVNTHAQLPSLPSMHSSLCHVDVIGVGALFLNACDCSRDPPNLS